jgi:uroporphyrin-III C-methyltransferase
MKLGKVYLVGAGPGDPELLTVKALRLIQNAGCIVYDHLVNAEIMAAAHPNAEMIYVGKQGHKCAMKQETINAILVTKATEHEIVVRLKGGDPFIFGRGGEEAEALISAGIWWEVVPGISSGAAAAAYAGIPITHRGISSSVTFITGHEDPTKTESQLKWQHLAHGSDTLVIFMGVAKIKDIAEQLLLHGRKAQTPVAFIQQGTYQHQTTHTCTLQEIPELLATNEIQSPAIIVIGEVVRLREQLQWFESKRTLETLEAINSIKTITSSI